MSLERKKLNIMFDPTVCQVTETIIIKTINTIAALVITFILKVTMHFPGQIYSFFIILIGNNLYWQVNTF